MAPTINTNGDLLHYAGLVLIGDLVLLTSTSVCYGILLVLFVFLAKIHMSPKRFTMPALRMFLVATIIFASTTLYWSLLLDLNIRILRTAFVNRPDLPLATNLTEANKASGVIFDKAEIWLQSLNFFLADAVLVFRVWVIVPSPKYLRWGNLGLLIASGVAALLACIVRMIASDASDNTLNNVWSNPKTDLNDVWSKAQLASWILSLVCNLVGTVLIGYRTWSYFHVSSPEHLRKIRRDPLSAGNTMAMLVESGGLYILLQIAFIALHQTTQNPSLDVSVSGTNIAAQSLLSCCIIFCGIYPISTLCIVALNRSIANRQPAWDHNTSLHIPNGSSRLSTVEFSAPPESQTLGSVFPLSSKG
ncbi:hypothetical protein DL96DRAFT_1636393 [Flagelloscypha sp. PMI_526]|nr:hypothetical protein DL96DRAFT_1636393 [Flagelloscypha sp. PMI_526]